MKINNGDHIANLIEFFEQSSDDRHFIQCLCRCIIDKTFINQDNYQFILCVPHGNDKHAKECANRLFLAIGGDAMSEITVQKTCDLRALSIDALKFVSSIGRLKKINRNISFYNTINVCESLIHEIMASNDNFDPNSGPYECMLFLRDFLKAAMSSRNEFIIRQTKNNNIDYINDFVRDKNNSLVDRYMAYFGLCIMPYSESYRWSRSDDHPEKVIEKTLLNSGFKILTSKNIDGKLSAPVNIDMMYIDGKPDKNSVAIGSNRIKNYDVVLMKSWHGPENKKDNFYYSSNHKYKWDPVALSISRCGFAHEMDTSMTRRSLSVNVIDDVVFMHVICAFIDQHFRHGPGIPYGAHEINNYHIENKQDTQVFWISKNNVIKSELNNDHIVIELSAYSYIRRHDLKKATHAFIVSLNRAKRGANVPYVDHPSQLLEYVQKKYAPINLDYFDVFMNSSTNARSAKCAWKIQGVVAFANPQNDCFLNVTLQMLLIILTDAWMRYGLVRYNMLPPVFDRMFFRAFETGCYQGIDASEIRSYLFDKKLITDGQCDITETIVKVFGHLDDYAMSNEYPNIFANVSRNYVHVLTVNVQMDFQTAINESNVHERVGPDNKFIIFETSVTNERGTPVKTPMFSVNYTFHDKKWRVEAIVFTNRSQLGRGHFAILRRNPRNRYNVLWIDDNNPINEIEDGDIWVEKEYLNIRGATVRYWTHVLLSLVP
jgi:hypothetical protein